MSEVRTAIVETSLSPLPRWLSELLTTDGFCTHTLMLCPLQVCDGARWAQSTPTDMGRFGRGDGPSWVVRRVG